MFKQTRIKAYHRKQLLFLAVFSLMLVGAFINQTQAAPQSPQAAATAAAVEAPNSFAASTLVTFKVYDVIASGASFGVSFYYDLAGTETLEAKSAYSNISVVLGTGDDDWVKTMVFPTPTAGGWIRIKVVDALTGTTTELAVVQMDVSDTETIFDALTDFVVTIGVALMIVFVFIGIIYAVARYKR